MLANYILLIASVQNAAHALLSRFLMLLILILETNSSFQIASTAAKTVEARDWFWQNQLGKCYYRLGMFTKAVSEFQTSLQIQTVPETYAFLAKVGL